MKVGYQNKQEKYLVWHIEGGLGKNIAATSLVSSIKERYPDRKFIMVSSHPEVFLQNPEIERVYPVGNTPYFYQNYIEDKDTLIFRQEGYFQSGHINKKQHLIQSWCELLDIEYKEQLPSLYLNLVQKRLVNLWQQEKPIMVIQTNGGPREDQRLYSWTRDMPPYIANEIVKHYSKDYYIYQVCRNPNQIIPGAHGITQDLSNFELFSLLAVSEKRILIDSCLQHAAAGMNLPSTVLWVGTSPTVFGYKQHNNIIATEPKNKSKLMRSYLFDYSFDGIADQCPYDDPTEIFNLSNLFNSINKE